TSMRHEKIAISLLMLDQACAACSDPRSARNRYAAAGAFGVHDRSNDQVARSFLALTSVNAFVTGRHRLRPNGTSPPTERRLSIRPSSGRPLLQVRVLRRRPEWLRSLQGAGRKDPLPESLPPKNRACDFHRTRLTHNKS